MQSDSAKSPDQSHRDMQEPFPTLDEYSDALTELIREQLAGARQSLGVRFGARGARLGELTIAMHLAYISKSLSCGGPEALADYLVWLKAAVSAVGLSEDTVAASLDLIATYLSDKLPAQQAAHVRSALSAALEAAGSRAADAPGPAYVKGLPLPFAETRSLVDALIGGETETVRELVRCHQDSGTSYLDLAERFFLPALYEIGALWQAHRITVAQEHLGTAIAQHQLALAFSASVSAAPTGRKALLACVEGEQHALGLRIVADAFELAGWETVYLGGDLPLDALLSQIELCRPELVALSVSGVERLPWLTLTVQALRSEFGSGCPAIMAGGLASNQVHELWKLTGADLWAPSAGRALVVAG